jgi:hypothetical protein
LRPNARKSAKTTKTIQKPKVSARTIPTASTGSSPAMTGHRRAGAANNNTKMPKGEKIYLSVDDFPEAIDVTVENGWITIWLSNCRIKFKNWVSQ